MLRQLGQGGRGRIIASSSGKLEICGIYWCVFGALPWACFGRAVSVWADLPSAVVLAVLMINRKSIWITLAIRG